MSVVGVTGASGLLGRAIVARLEKHGHEVVVFSRTPGSTPGARPYTEPLDLQGINAVIHLAGEPILGPWTKAKKRRILESREQGTRWVAAAIRSAQHPPKVLVSASGANYYGDSGDTELSEEMPPGDGFLSEVVRRWEAAALQAAAEDTRVVCLRLGMVLAADGGAAKMLYRLFRSGLGGRVGSGRQWMPWIHIEDAAALFVHALDCADLTGPVNAVAPGVVTNADFTAAMARVAGRPAILPAPAFALRTILGGLSDLALHSIRPVVDKATGSGFNFHYPEIDEALGGLFGKRRRC